MHSRSLLWFVAATALALAGCSGSDNADDNTGISGSAEFVRLVEDARFEADRGNLAQAGQLLDEAREIEPENPGLWVDIARLRFRGGEHLTALEAADFALELGPQYAPALLMRAQLVRDAHGLSAALPWFEAAIRADPRNPELLADYAATLGDLGRYKDMLAVVRKLAGIEPRHPQVFYLQAVLATRAGETVLARSLLSRSGLVEREVPAAILLNALIDMQQATPDNAVQSLQQLANRQPGNIRLLELLAKALWLSGRDTELIEQFGERARAGDASPYLAELVGRAHERMGDRIAAAAFLDRAASNREVRWAVLGNTVAGGSTLPGPTVQLRQMISGQDPSGAEAFARELLDRFPKSSDVRALAGDAMLAGGDAESALDFYGTAASVRRPWPLTRKIVAAYRAYGDNRAADTLLIRHLSGEPNNTEALAMLAERSALAEDWLRVAVLLDHSISMGAGHDPRLLTMRARAAEALGNDQEAERFRDRAQALQPVGFVAN
ncbi:MAG: hypothetical protein QNJ15_03060 [Erythrobacter sp.]|nr:hypothetical protein [Erythrobacter sp.]